ncbi:hypothetical protein [Sphingomonas sp. 67-36]|nr:hypothetical protein [Sphingomonas sp. 67-36]
MMPTIAINMAMTMNVSGRVSAILTIPIIQYPHLRRGRLNAAGP